MNDMTKRTRDRNEPRVREQASGQWYTQNGYHVDMSFYRVANWIITIDNAKQNNNRQQ